MSAAQLMLRQRPFIVEALTAIGLIAAPFVLPYLGFAPTTVNRILVWGLFGLGFDILFGFTGLLSFGQSAFFGTGGMVAAYLLTVLNYPDVITSALRRHDRGRRCRLSGRPDRATAHRHIFRHDHGGDRRSIFLRRIQSALGLHGRRERVAGRADADRCRSASPRCSSTTTPRSIGSWRSGILSASCSRCASCVRRSAPSCAPSATIRCARPPSATTSMAIS